MITLRRARPSKATAKSDPAETLRARYEGCLQGVGNGHALGWCWQPSAPNEVVKVAIVVDGEIAAEGMADIARPDLAARAVGARGFMIALPDSLQAPGRRRVLALAGSERVPIVTAPSFWHKAKSSNGWSDVVFEPAESPSGPFAPVKVPRAPTQADLRATVLADWLFDARESQPCSMPSDAELDELVGAFADLARALSSLDIAYIPAIVPTKREAIGVAPVDKREWVVGLTTRLRDVNDVELLDLLPVLRDAARHGVAYHRTDADWNPRGAFFVARALLKEAHKRAPSLQAPELAELHLRSVPGYRGTLADVPKLEILRDELVPIEHDVEAERGIVIDARALSALRMPVDLHLAQAGSTHLRVYAAPGQSEDARLAIVGDSAALALVPWLAEHTSRTTFFWTRELPMAQLELELPLVLFHLIRETELMNLPERELDVPYIRSTAVPATVSPAAVAGTSPVAAVPAAPVVAATPPAHIEERHSELAGSSRPPGAARLLVPAWLERWGPALVLAAGILAFCALMLYDTRRLGFWQDEWSFVTTRLGWSPEVFLRAFNQQPMMLTVFVYKLLLPTVGLQHTWPYRLALFGMHGLCVTLLWLLARKRLGSWLALVPAGLLLVLGAAWEDLTLALQINYLGSVAAGLGALLCLDRRDRRGDRLACGLLVVAWMWSSVGVPIALGIAVELAWSRRDWRRLWIVALPLALYGLWYLVYGSSTAELVNLRALPHYFVAGSAATLGGIIGLEELGKILLVGCTALVIRQTLRPQGLSSRAAMGLGAFLAFWLITDLNRAQYGQPNASRYMYPAAIFALITAVAMLRRLSIPLRGYLIIMAALGGVWLSGYDQLLTAAYNRDVVDTEVKAELGAVDVAGSAVSGAVLPDEHHAPVLTVAAYRKAERTLRSRAGFTVPQILSSGGQNREIVDEKLVSWEGIAPVPMPAAAIRGTGSGPAPRLVKGSIVHTHGSCEEIAGATANTNNELAIASGNRLVIHPVRGQSEVGVSLKRFAAQFLQPSTFTASARDPLTLRFPKDESALPWHARVNSSSSLVLCQAPS
jgi:SGNH hydrolase-like domain, acetyltransferase AlgX